MDYASDDHVWCFLLFERNPCFLDIFLRNLIFLGDYGKTVKFPKRYQGNVIIIQFIPQCYTKFLVKSGKPAQFAFELTAWKLSKTGIFSSSYFPVFGLNTKICGANHCIQSEYRKIRTRKNSVFGHFSRSDNFSKNIYLGTFIKLSKVFGVSQFSHWHSKFYIYIQVFDSQSFEQGKLIHVTTQGGFLKFGKKEKISNHLSNFSYLSTFVIRICNLYYLPHTDFNSVLLLPNRWKSLVAEVVVKVGKLLFL